MYETRYCSISPQAFEVRAHEFESMKPILIALYRGLYPGTAAFLANEIAKTVTISNKPPNDAVLIPSCLAKLTMVHYDIKFVISMPRSAHL